MVLSFHKFIHRIFWVTEQKDCDCNNFSVCCCSCCEIMIIYNSFLYFDSDKSFIQMYHRIMFLFGLTNALQCYKCGPDGDKVAHHKMAK